MNLHTTLLLVLDNCASCSRSCVGIVKDFWRSGGGELPEAQYADHSSHETAPLLTGPQGLLGLPGPVIYSRIVCSPLNTRPAGLSRGDLFMYYKTAQ